MRNVGEIWIFWMNIAAWNFIGLSVLGFLSIIGACFPPARKFAACCGCFGTVFHLFTIIALTILSFSNDGQFCSTPLLNGLIKENDTYGHLSNIPLLSDRLASSVHNSLIIASGSYIQFCESISNEQNVLLCSNL